MILFIHPPVAKNCEPPGGIPKLVGALRGHGFDCCVLDCSHEGLLFLLNRRLETNDTWSKRAVKNCGRNKELLTTWEAYSNRDRYHRCVSDLNRLLELHDKPERYSLTLSNFSDKHLSPLKSGHLIRAAENYRDNIFFPYFSKRLREVINDTQPSLIGLSLNYLNQAVTTFSMIGFIREHFPHIPIIAGGGLVTSWLCCSDHPNPFLTLIDHVITGPGEEPLLRLLGWKKDINYYPPDYSDFTPQTYFSPGLILPYAASSGCYWNRCSFCPEKAENTPYTQLPVNQIMDDLNHLVETTKPILIHFLDNAIPPHILDRLSNTPKLANWYGFVRFSKRFEDLDYCRELKRSGCVMLKLGLESGDQSVLDRLNKGISLEVVSKTLLNLKQAGIATYVYLLFGTPAESIKEARKTLDFIINHHDCITYLNLAIFNMPVNSSTGTGLQVDPFYEGDLSLYCNFTHPKGFNRKQVRQFLDKEFKRTSQIAAILRRDPPFYTSNHAPLFQTTVYKSIQPS